MRNYTKRLPLWLILSVLGLIVLTACSTLVTGGGVDVTLDEEEPAALLDELESDLSAESAAGSQAGQELQPIVHGDHFWFSWAAFKPDTIIFQG